MVKFVILISEASVTAGLAALAVILIRLAMKKAPKRWAYALWAVVFFRCLCPFSAESAVSLFNVIPERTPEVLETAETSTIVSEINTRPPVMERFETDLQSYGYTPYPIPVLVEPVKETPAPVKKPVNKNAIIFAVWAAGTLAMTLYGVISYVLLMRRLRTAVKTEDGVYESDLISTAFSAGFFPPKIYVPCGLFEEERKLIIAHERVHIRRLDYIVKPVAFIALAVHWFNPVIWLAFALMTRDMELSCDEAVLKIFGAGEKKAYSEALLHVSMKRSGLTDNYKFMPLAFAETGIKGRVKNVLKYKKPTLIVTVLAAAVVIAACAALGTNAKSKTEDTDENIRYVILQNDVNNSLLDADGEQIFLFKELNHSTEKGIVEGEMSFDSVAFTINEELENTLIMDADITELKINSMDVVQEDGKNILKLQLEFKAADGFVNHGKMVSGDSFGEKLHLLMTEGGGNEGVYTLSAEYELEESGIYGYSFRIYGFGDIPVYINSDLVKPNEPDEDVYVPLSEGETGYTLDSGENICIDYDPDMDVKIADIVQKITFNAEPDEGSKNRSVLIGMRAKNNELNRQCGADFTGEKITGLAIDDIIVSQNKFTVKFKITYAEGGGGIFIDENEPNSPIRVIRSANENEAYLYLTADYYRGNVDEYAIDLHGFDNITPQIHSRFKTTEEKAAEYARISSVGWAQVTLETGETGYVAYDENDIPINADDWTFSTKGITGKGVSIGCFTTIGEGSSEASFCGVLDFGDHPVTAVTVENMYTEKSGSTVKLYTEIKVACPEGDGLMNSMSVNGGEFEMGVAKLINDEYLFTIIKEYDTKDIVIDGFAVVVNGFETPPYINTDHEIPVYVNSALDPQSPQIITYEAYERFYDEEAMQKSTEEEVRKREEEEQRKLEELRKLTEYEGAAKYGIEFIEGVMKDGNVSAAYLNGTNVLILWDDGTFWYDLIITNYSHFPHQTDYTLNDGVLVLNYKDGGALYFKQEGDKFIFDESSSKRGSTMEAPFFEDGYTLTSYETVVGGQAEEKNNVSVTSSYPALQYPVDGVITAGYGDGRGHKGVDFYAEKGTEIYAAADGTVSKTGSGWNGGYGTSVTIDHGSGIETVYAHLSDVTVEEGDKVAKGDLIGHAGSTGDTTGNELHFEIRVNGKHVDPVKYIALQERGTVSATYYDMAATLVLNKDGTFSVGNYFSSHIPSERPEKEYKFENGILSLEFTNGSVICFETVGNDLVYRKDLSNYIYSIDIPSFGSNGTLELIAGTSLNGGSIEMDTIELNGKTYCLVSNETQLRAIGGIAYGLDLNYMQQCDIELSPDEWKAIGTRKSPFTGSYNGNGFEIKGLTMTDPYATLVGMFGYAENANIYNITLRDYDIEKAGSKAKTKSCAPIVAINVGSRVYDNNVYPKSE